MRHWLRIEFESNMCKKCVTDYSMNPILSCKECVPGYASYCNLCKKCVTSYTFSLNLTCARNASLATHVRKSLWDMYSGIILFANLSRNNFSASDSELNYIKGTVDIIPSKGRAQFTKNLWQPFSEQNWWKYLSFSI